MKTNELFFFLGGEAHVSGPPARLHDQCCYDAVNGESHLIIHIVSLHHPLLHFFFLSTTQQIGVTFAIVFGVILYRISMKAALHMSPNPVTRSHVQLTVKTTAAIINLVVILILDEVYGAVARWLTVLGKFSLRLVFACVFWQIDIECNYISFLTHFRPDLTAKHP